MKLTDMEWKEIHSRYDAYCMDELRVLAESGDKTAINHIDERYVYIPMKELKSMAAMGDERAAECIKKIGDKLRIIERWCRCAMFIEHASEHPFFRDKRENATKLLLMNFPKGAIFCAQELQTLEQYEEYRRTPWIMLLSRSILVAIHHPQIRENLSVGCMFMNKSQKQPRRNYLLSAISKTIWENITGLPRYKNRGEHFSKIEVEKQIKYRRQEKVVLDDGAIQIIVGESASEIEDAIDKAQENDVKLKMLLDGLSENELELLRCIEHGSITELAIRMGIKPNTLTKRRERLLARLAKKYG